MSESPPGAVRSRPGMKGYGISSDEEGILPWDWAEKRLRESRNYWIATTRPDGRPHCMPVWGAWLEGAFYFGTGASSVKARNLWENPALCVHLESGDEAVILEGRAETSESISAALDEAYQSKYSMKPSDGPPAALFRLRPRRVLAWRERDYPTSATRWTFS